MHPPTDRIADTTAFVTPVVEHWLEWEIAQWVHPMKDRSDDPSHHEWTLLPQSYISLRTVGKDTWLVNTTHWPSRPGRPCAAAWLPPFPWATFSVYPCCQGELHFLSVAVVADLRVWSVHGGGGDDVSFLTACRQSYRRAKKKERSVLFNDAFKTFYFSVILYRTYGVTIQIVREETRCRHMGYSFQLAARVLLYAPSHRQDSTYHSLCYTSRGALAGTRNSSMGPPHEGSIRRPAPYNGRRVKDRNVLFNYHYIVLISHLW